MNFLKQSQSTYKLKTVKKGGWIEKVLLIMHSTTSLWTVPRLYIQLPIKKDKHVHLQVQWWKPRTMAAPLVFTNDKENSALCTPAPPSSWWLETVISSEVQIHYSEHMHPHAHGHTFTLNKATLPILHCRSFSTAAPRTHWSNYRSEVARQSHPTSIYNGASPTPFLPILPAFSSFIHPPLFTPFCSAVISHFVSSKWLLTVLTELSFFVCLHHKCVCQSQAYALCIVTTLLWPLLYLTEIDTSTSVTLANSHVFIFFFCI